MALGLASPGGLANPPTARGATTVEICGQVSLYVKPTVLFAGAVTVGAVPFIIAAGTSVPASVEVDADVCLRLTLNTGGTITNIVSVNANASATVRICGHVTAYVDATLTRVGNLTIGGRHFVLAYGTNLPASFDVGSNLCATLELNAFGQVEDGNATANTTVIVKICGEINAYGQASLTQTGNLTIGGRHFVLALGSDLPASFDVGADLCAMLELNAFGQVKDGSATADVTAIVKICGEVTAYSEGSLTQTGNLTIGGRHFVLALGSDLPANFNVGADLCATLELNVFGQVKEGSATADVTAIVKICGEVSGYSEASLTQTGDMTVGGRHFDLALGSDLPSSFRSGADLCATLNLNAFAQVQDGTATANVTSEVTVCGQVTAYTSATSINNGNLTMGGVSRTIAAGAEASSNVQAGIYAKLLLEVDVFGRVSKITTLSVGASLAAACGTATPTPTPSPTPDPGATPTPTPDPGATPTPTPDPGATPTPTPDPSATPDPEARPSPTPTPTPDPSEQPGDPREGPDVCPPSGSGSDNSGNPIAAPNLPESSTAERATEVIAIAGFPWLVLGLAIVAWELFSRRRRMSPEAAFALTADDYEEGQD